MTSEQNNPIKVPQQKRGISFIDGLIIIFWGAILATIRVVSFFLGAANIIISLLILAIASYLIFVFLFKRYRNEVVVSLLLIAGFTFFDKLPMFIVLMTNAVPFSSPTNWQGALYIVTRMQFSFMSHLSLLGVISGLIVACFIAKKKQNQVIYSEGLSLEQNSAVNLANSRKIKLFYRIGYLIIAAIVGAFVVGLRNGLDDLFSYMLEDYPNSWYPFSQYATYALLIVVVYFLGRLFFRRYQGSRLLLGIAFILFPAIEVADYVTAYIINYKTASDLSYFLVKAFNLINAFCVFAGLLLAHFTTPIIKKST